MWTKHYRDTDGNLQQARYKEILRSSFKGNSDSMTYSGLDFGVSKNFKSNTNDDMTHFVNLIWVAFGRPILLSPHWSVSLKSACVYLILALLLLPSPTLIARAHYLALLDTLELSFQDLSFG
jgi:hypothetical protein